MSESNNGSLRGWIVCLTAALFFFYNFVQMTMFNAIVPSLMQAFHVSSAEIGNLSGALLYATVLFLLPAGLLLDRFSTKKLILLSFVLSLVAMLLFSFTSSFHLAVFYRFLMGISGAFVFLACMRLASRWFPPKRMALISGCIVTMAFLGGVVSQTPLTLLVDAYGWRLALQGVVLLGVLFFVMILLLVQDQPKEYQQQVKPEEIMSITSLGHSLKKASLNVQNWFFGLYISLLNLPIFLLGGTWGGLYLVQVDHLSKAQASYITSMLFIGAMIGSALIGWISDKISLRKLPMIVFGIIALLNILVIMYVPHLPLGALLVLFFSLGFVVSAQVVGYPAIAENNSPAITSSAMSFASILVMGGSALFLPLFGKIMDAHWSGQLVNSVRVYSLSDYRTALMIMPVAFTVGLIAVIMARESHCKQQA